MRVFTTIAAALLFAACATRAPFAGRPTIESTKGGVSVRNGSVGWATKRALTKQPPETIIAQDGSVCRVAAQRYADTKVGDDVACDWQPGNPVTTPPVQ